MLGPVESILLDRIRDEHCIHLALVDPEKFGAGLSETIDNLEQNGTAAILVGGSTVRSGVLLDRAVKTIRRSSSLPTILFPNGPTGVSRFAHAIFFMSLLNSSSTEYLIEAQAAGAPAVKRFNLEPIPLGYLIVGESKTAVRRVGRARPIPFSSIDVAVNYALAAQYLGMRFVYLEAGSGANEPVNEQMISKVSDELNIPVIVGGGVRTASQAERLAKAGASAIVTGTVLEREGSEKVKQILQAIRRAQ